jgi:transporter family-2 protein
VPLLAGAMTSVQSALNGRVRAASASSLTATTVNFLVGSVFLLGCSGLAWLLGARVTGLPELPGQAWLLMGGALGIVFIGVTSATVSHLGVLLVSMTSLFGNLLSSVLVDLLHPGAVITPLTVVAMVCVLAGVGAHGSRLQREGHASSMKRPSTRVPKSRDDSATRSSLPWNIAAKSRSGVSRSGAKP